MSLSDSGVPPEPVLPIGDPSPVGSAASPVPGSPASVVDDGAYAPRSRVPDILQRPLTRGILVLVLLSMVLGALAGVVWNLVVDLPEYHLDDAGNATTTEYGLTEVFASDAVFVLIGTVLGLVIGVSAWKCFRRIGWPVVMVAMGASLVAGLTCWWVGVLMGPHGFHTRIAQAQPGDVVPIDFELHACSAMLVWPFFATIPVLLWSSLGRDEQAVRSAKQRRSATPATPASSSGGSTPVPPPTA